MLRVTIDIVPHGNESASETIGQYIVYNDGTGSHEIGNYTILDELAGGDGDHEPLGTRIGKIYNFERQKPSYTKGWLRLIAQAMNVIMSTSPEAKGKLAKGINKFREDEQC